MPLYRDLSASATLTDPPRAAPALDEDFSSGLDPRWWIPEYLPQWTTPDRSAARWRSVSDGLELRIEEDQPQWREEDAPLRVSNIQTGTASGPVGSRRGICRHREDGLLVRTETPQRLLFAPSRGRIDVTLSATAAPGTMTAAWLVGIGEPSPEDSGEICLVEIDAEAIGPTTRARTGVKAHQDPRLETDMAEVTPPVDARRPHTWTAIWDGEETILGCEGTVLRRIPQSPGYPLILLVDLFEIGPPTGTYPKSATVHRVRGWSW